jgi:hypothetical protein
MWLLDVNLPNGLLRFLRDSGIACDTAARRGWRALTNGDLVEAACRNGFTVLLTRDRLFGESAGATLARRPGLAVVIVNLPQAREAAYLAAFETRWRQGAIEPVPGVIVEWP